MRPHPSLGARGSYTNRMTVGLRASSRCNMQSVPWEMLGNLLSRLGILQKHQKLFAQATDFRNTIIDSGTTCNISAQKILMKDLGDGARIELTTSQYSIVEDTGPQLKVVAALSPCFTQFIYLVEACADCADALGCGLAIFKRSASFCIETD